MKTIYLHIGIPMTATASIQRTLDYFDNNIILKKHNIWAITSISRSYIIYEYLYNKINKEKFEELRQLHWFENPMSENRMLYVTKDFEEEMKACDCDKIVISCEEISQFFDVEDLEKLKIYLSSLFDEEVKFKIIIFFRNPIGFTESFMQSKIKFYRENQNENYNVKIPKTYLRPDYVNCIKRFKTVFGKNSLIVGSFDNALTKKDSIIGEFFSKLDFYDIDKLNVFFVNESMSQLAFDINCYMNNNEPYILTDGSDNNKRQFGDLQGFDGAKGDKFRLNHKLRLEIIEAYKEDTRYLEENYNIKFEYKLNENDDAKFEFTDELIKSFERGYLKTAYVLRPTLLKYIDEKINISEIKIEKDKLLVLKKKLMDPESLLN